VMTWVEHRSGRSRVVCAHCQFRGPWRLSTEWPTTAAERTAHAAICATWSEFCELWHRIAWSIGRNAPYYWSSVNPPGL
jgi:hypothetical protein